MTDPISAEIILQNLIAQGRIIATGNRQFSLDAPLQPRPIESGSIPNNTIDALISASMAVSGTVDIVPEVLPSYDELVAAELADAGIILEPDISLIIDGDPTLGMTAASAAALGLSEEDFASLGQSVDEKTATTASVSNQGDRGKGLPKVPMLDLSSALGSVGKGASPITIAAQAALTAAITTYVTNYVASQIAPLQMQVSSVASAVPAGAGKIAQIPGKIKSIIAKVQSVVAKVKTTIAKVQSISKMAPTMQKQVRDKAAEARAKITERARLTSTGAANTANRVAERAGDTATQARRTVIQKMTPPKSGIIHVNKQITGDGAVARARATQAINNSLNPTAGTNGILQNIIISTDPITGLDSNETITEAIGPSVETQSQQTMADSSVQSQSSVLGLPAVPSRATPEQYVARRRAVDMYIRNPNSLSIAITLYVTNGGTRSEFMEEAGISG